MAQPISKPKLTKMKKTLISVAALAAFGCSSSNDSANNFDGSIIGVWKIKKEWIDGQAQTLSTCRANLETLTFGDTAYNSHYEDEDPIGDQCFMSDKAGTYVYSQSNHTLVKTFDDFGTVVQPWKVLKLTSTELIIQLTDDEGTVKDQYQRQ
jgi:hypothetical protein